MAAVYRRRDAMAAAVGAVRAQGLGRAPHESPDRSCRPARWGPAPDGGALTHGEPAPAPPRMASFAGRSRGARSRDAASDPGPPVVPQWLDHPRISRRWAKVLDGRSLPAVRA